MRHSAAHVMAAAVCRLFENVQLDIGPPTEDGFYYDFDLPHRFAPEDFPRIEEEMRKIVAEDQPFERTEATRAEAEEIIRKRGQKFKLERLAEIPEGETITFYRNGEFQDLCRGPHVASTGRIKSFKLLSVAGSYFHGVETNPMLQRLYATAFEDAAVLEAHLKQIEEARLRDHRKLGRELDIFHVEEHTPGQVFWHPRGALLYNLVRNHVRRVITERGYHEVITPEVVEKSLWQKSGHLETYASKMFMTTAEEREFVLKPMNCPCHVEIFKQGVKSWRDLPLRMAEFGKCHRNESGGTLHGLMRVRGFVQDDAHIFCTEDQIASEVKDFCRLVQDLYADFGFRVHEVRFATRPEKRIGSDELWDKAERALAEATAAAGLETTVNPGEGAFYGPKLEFVLLDCLGRDWQCGTIQVDFNLPERLGAQYVGQDNQRHTPVMLHRAALGSIERFLGILIEHHGGGFPLWLAPEQVRVLPMTDKQLDYGNEVAGRLRAAGFRAAVDPRPEKIGAKIRDAQVQKVPYMLIVGGREAAAGQVSLRSRTKGDQGVTGIEQVIERFRAEEAARGSVPEGPGGA
jgi:threonyl-tRNA synthetase